MKKSVSIGCVLSAAALWGCIALFYNGLSAVGMSPIQAVLIRVSFAACMMLVYILIRDPSLLKIRFRDIWLFIGTGVASLAFFNYCYFRAMDMLSPSVAAVLLYTAPAFVLLMSALFYREPITKKKLLCFALTLVGCFLVTEVFGGSVSSPPGILLGLGSGFGYALYTIFSVKALRRYRTETITFYTFVAATASVLPLSEPLELMKTVAAFPTETVLYGGGIALFACVLPYLLYTKGLQGVSPGQASVMATLEPVVAAVIGVSLLGDSLSVQKVLGMLLILGGIFLLNIPKMR